MTVAQFRQMKGELYMLFRRKKDQRWAFIAAVLFLQLHVVAAPDEVPISLSAELLTCEYVGQPMNVDLPRPRLAWVLAGNRRGDVQTGYQVLVASTAAKLAADIGDLWDTGRVATDQTIQIPYSGRALESARRYFWKVRVWDGRGNASPYSPPTFWETGPLVPGDWHASWISSSAAPADSQAPAGAKIEAQPIFRKSFAISKPVDHAVIYICGLGQYELHLNGQRVSESVLDPGWTDYRKTCLYQGYDVTKVIRTGTNVVGVMLGNGMYDVAPTPGRYTKFTGSFGPLKLIATLRIVYQDGTSEAISSDVTWKTTDGPVTFSNIFGGEDYDARREKAGWDDTPLEGPGWRATAESAGPGGVLAGVSHSAPPIVVAGQFKAQNISEPRPNVWVYDFAQNCAQVPSITVTGRTGASIKLVPGELLNADGTVSQQSSGGPSWFTYVLKGGGAETWSPRFTYYGSRYIQITGAVPDGKLNPEGLPQIADLHGLFITSSSPAVGEFECSDIRFNRTAEIIRWSMRSNLMSVMTDCPHRERLGWLEETHLVGPSLMYNFEIPALFTKISADTADAQIDGGLVPDIAPEFAVFSGGFRDSPEWGSAAVLIPWQVYQWYGDTALLVRLYPTMSRYVDYLGTKATDHILSHGLGDWYDIGPGPPGYAQLTSIPLTATAFYFRDIMILKQVAGILGHHDDEMRYEALGKQIGDAFNRKLYHPELKCYDRNSQTANAIPLVFGLAPERDRVAILDNLVKDVRSRGGSLTAGDIGYRYVLRALADGGRSDVIFDMNNRSDKPGYGMMLAKGATSLTEAWDARPSSSQDHFMLGHIMEWFYGDLAGIQPDPDAVGFKNIVIKPTPVGDLTWAKAGYQSVRGKIGVDWAIHGNTFDLNVVIPPNCTATVLLPGRFSKAVTERGTAIAEIPGIILKQTDPASPVMTVQSGTYHFMSRAE